VDAIEVADLSKQYGPVRAVDNVSFTVAEGEIFALLGPNGAGKTTTMEILEGFRKPSGGQVRVLGFDPATGGRAFRERVGIVLQAAGFEEEFTVRELVRLQAGFFPRRHDPDEIIDLVGLAGKRTARVKGLSGGQRRRLDLALGLVGAPELLFLDEPTTGFDPSARRRAWELVGQLRESGVTVMLTTHYMEEAQQLADRVGVLQDGKLIAQGPPAELGGLAHRGSILTFRLPAGAEIDVLPQLSGTATSDDGTVTVHTPDPTADLHLLTGWAREHRLELSQLSLREPTLEEVYLALTGEQGRSVALPAEAGDAG
jgi:ABC-type multidrug transport system ATPase subunit